MPIISVTMHLQSNFVCTEIFSTEFLFHLLDLADMFQKFSLQFTLSYFHIVTDTAMLIRYYLILRKISNWLQNCLNNIKNKQSHKKAKRQLTQIKVVFIGFLVHSQFFRWWEWDSPFITPPTSKILPTNIRIIIKNINKWIWFRFCHTYFRW